MSETDQDRFEQAGAQPDSQPSGIVVNLYGQTDVGLVREHNEDNLLCCDLSTGARMDESVRHHTIGPKGTLLAACDGMGGAAAGEVASQMAVDAVYEVMMSGAPNLERDEFARLLVQSVEEAGRRIYQESIQNRAHQGMGTTSTVAALTDKVLFIGQVGDSRAYLMRGGVMTLLTRDQSLVTQLIESGQLTPEEAEQFEHSNIILQALGTQETVDVDLTFLELRRGDRIMMCSDGLSGLVHHEMMADVLRETPDQAQSCATLIEMARNGGGHDNITVIVADFDGAGLEPPTGQEQVGYAPYPLMPAAGTMPPPEMGSDRASSVPSPTPTFAGEEAEPALPMKPPILLFALVAVALVGLFILASVAAIYLFGATEETGHAPTEAVPIVSVAPELLGDVDTMEPFARSRS